MSKILEILNEENYEDIEIYANTKEELENKVVEYLRTEEYEDKIEKVLNNLIWQGEGLYSIVGINFGCDGVGLTKDFEKAEFESSTTLQDYVYVVENDFKVNSDALQELDEFSMKTYGKHCISEEEYNYRQELKKRYNFSDDLIEKIINKQDGICELEKDITEENFYEEHKNDIYLGYEPSWDYYYFLNKDLKTLYYIRSYYDHYVTELK